MHNREKWKNALNALRRLNPGNRKKSAQLAERTRHSLTYNPTRPYAGYKESRERSKWFFSHPGLAATVGLMIGVAAGNYEMKVFDLSEIKAIQSRIFGQPGSVTRFFYGEDPYRPQAYVPAGAKPMPVVRR